MKQCKQTANRKPGLTKQLKIFLALLLVFLFSAENTEAQTWDETDKIVASNRAPQDFFGYDVRTTENYNDNFVVVGAPNHDSFGKINSGAVYVFRRNGSEWEQVPGVLYASDGVANDYFGRSVSISESGEFIVIGAPGQDTDHAGNNPFSSSGAVYIFQRSGLNSWVETQKIVAIDVLGNSDREIGANFGKDVDISGTKIIVGASGESHDASLPSLNQSGAAYVFQFHSLGGSGNWYMQTKLTASDRAALDNFGFSVAISEKSAVVGAINNSYGDGDGDDSYLPQSGSAYVFENPLGNIWNETDKLTSSDRGIGERFGFAVDIFKSEIVVGAPYDDENEVGNVPINSAGSAFVYQKNFLTGEWPQQKKLIANDRSTEDYFGVSVGLTKAHIAVGAPNNETDANGGSPKQNAGAVYLYALEYALPGGYSWNFNHKIVSSDRDVGDNFGIALGIDIYGGQCAVGARAEDEDDGDNPGNYMNSSGSAYIFEFDVPEPIRSAVSNVNEGTILRSGQRQHTISPNPSNGQFVLKLIEFDPAKKYDLSVYDMLGKKIKEERIFGPRHVIDLESFSDGVYITILTDDKEVYTSKLIKSN